MSYTATYSHGENNVGGTLTLKAKTDQQAMSEIKDFVQSGYRNETAASVDLSDGRLFQAWNSHGDVKTRTLNV